MRIILNPQQRHKLNQWFMVGLPHYATKQEVAEAATNELGFPVTVPHIILAEKATGIRLVIQPPPKADAETVALLDRVSNLEGVTQELRDQLAIFSQWCRVPIPERLKEAYIKPSSNMPLFCHKHG
jgi:hypothetical protein